MVVTVGEVVSGSKSASILGINNRAQILDYIKRAVELAAYKANFNPWLSTIDLCSDGCGYVTLPYFVGTVLATNIGGFPAWFRNSWYEFSVNGVGSSRNVGGGGTAAWPSCGAYWDDLMWTPTFQDIKEWSYLAAICEDPLDGDGSLELIVQGETVDGNYNSKELLTVPVTGPSSPGVRIPLLNGYAATDPKTTPVKRVTQVTKPVTRGYVKLIAFPSRQMASAVTIGYYAPHETNPRYRKIRVGAKCQWVRCRYRRAEMALVNDYDIVPIESYEATLQLLKSIRLRETDNFAEGEVCERKAIEMLTDQLQIQDGPGFMPIQVDPANFMGTVDFR